MNIEKIIIKTEGLKIKSCTINEKLDVFSSSFNSDISLSESTINTYIRLFGITSNYISLYKLVVSGNLNVDSCKLKNGIIFNDGSFKDNVFFTLNQTEQSGLSITGSSFEKSFEIKYFSSQQPSARGISDYYINSAKFSNGFIVRGISNLAAISPKVNKITVNISSLLIGSIVFDSLDVGILNITGYNTSAKLTFKHLEINQIKVKDLINEGGLVFTNLIASNIECPDKTYPHLMLDSALYVDNSNLGKAQFFQTDFKSFKKIIFNNVILTEITTSNVTWFTPK